MFSLRLGIGKEEEGPVVRIAGFHYLVSVCPFPKNLINSLTRSVPVVVVVVVVVVVALRIGQNGTKLTYLVTCKR